MSEKLLVLAYMGTGKTEAEKRYRGVVDFDFQDFRYIYDESIRHLPLEQRKGSVNLRTENPDYPMNFLKAALEHLEKGTVVISPFIDHVFSAFAKPEFTEKAKDVRIILVSPTLADWNEYENRFRNRGNSDEFIERRRIEFPKLMELFEKAEGYEKILMKPGQFLDQALIQNGISLQLK